MANMDYINSLSVEHLREELAHALDSKYGLLYALRDWPMFPEPFILKQLSMAASFPEDWKRGKELQSTHGLQAIPPKTECEMGAGLWDKIRTARDEYLAKKPLT